MKEIFMKKVISFLVCFVFLLVGCQKKEKDFYLTYNGFDLYLNRVYNEKDYGKANSHFENESCAFGDKDVIYMYDDIEIETYGNSKGELIVYSIYFTGDDVKTNEGIGLYDTISDVINIYGKKYTQDGNKYVYERNNTSLIFITENDVIRKIEYRTKNVG